METSASIDRLTILAVGKEELQRYIGYSEYVLGQRPSNNYMYRHAFSTMDGSHIEVGDKGEFRLDFNPNKANMDKIEEMISTVRYPRLSRMDIAIDYFGVDLSEYEWHSVTRRKTTDYRGMDGKLETHYIGASGSERQYRIYDKLRERLDKDASPDPRSANGHWRVEIQQRYSEAETAMYDYADYFKKDFFTDITPHRKHLDLSFIESGTEKVIVRGLLAEPGLIEELSVNSRTKYRKLLKEAKEKGNTGIIHPSEVLKKEKAHLVGQLSELLEKSIKPLQLL